MPRYGGPLCAGVSNANNFSASYLGIYDPATDHYFIVGFERTFGYSLRWVAIGEYTAGGDRFRVQRYSPFAVDSEVGVRHTFRVLFNSACRGGLGCLKAYIDTTLWLDSGFNPFNFFDSGWGSGPWQPRFYSATGYLASSIPGTPTARVPFTSLGAQRVSDLAVVPMPCTMFSFNNKPSAWGLNATDCDDINAWTVSP